MKANSSVGWDKLISNCPEWTRRTAPMALSILLDRLKRRLGPISYGDLAWQMHERFGEPVQPNKQKYGRPLGAAAEAAIEIGRNHGMQVPPLSLIVIREDIGYPGTGADQFVRRLDESDFKLELKSPQRMAILDDEIEKVLAFDTSHWERLEQLIGLAPLPKPRRKSKKLGPPPKVSRRGGGEQPAHAALKQWVVNHPEKFREFGHYTSGKSEQLLQSGDSIDAMLLGQTTRLAVEVKASNATQDELIRGIFQCVKYRNTLEAEARVYPSEKLPGTCILVSTVALSSEAQAIADLLEVPFRKLAMRCERVL